MRRLASILAAGVSVAVLLSLPFEPERVAPPLETDRSVTSNAKPDLPAEAAPAAPVFAERSVEAAPEPGRAGEAAENAAPVAPAADAVRPPAGRQAEFTPHPSFPPEMLSALGGVIERVRSDPSYRPDATLLPDPDARALVEWIALRLHGPRAGFDRFATFIERRPDWPDATLRRRAETALLTDRKRHDTVAAFFRDEPPATPGGRLAFARALAARGETAKARDFVRALWRDDAAAGGLDATIDAEFPGARTSDDHRRRVETLLHADRFGEAAALATKVGSGVVALVRAFGAAENGAGNAKALIDAIPAELRSDPLAIYARARQGRRTRDLLAAAKAFGEQPSRPVHAGDAVWTERRSLVRALLDAGEFKAAHGVAAGHEARTDANRADAEIHAGWVALRYVNDPALARSHLDRAVTVAIDTPSYARALYWRARTLEVQDDREGAERDYARAARFPGVYHAQLAAERIGLSAASSDACAAPRVDGASGEVAPHGYVRGLAMLYAVRERVLARQLAVAIAGAARDGVDRCAAAALAEAELDATTLVVMGKAANSAGATIGTLSHPVFGFPLVGPSADHGLSLAIARQESAFDPVVMSHAGARGLMQLMPATARATALAAGMPFELERLTADPGYNAAVGTRHLAELDKEWGGARPLMMAAYNAGSGNVRKWIAAYGDPRKPEVDEVDWVERIPFAETRNYVQLVTANLKVYQAMIGDGPSVGRRTAALPVPTASR